MDHEIAVDGTDLEIIDLLVRDGRRTLAEIGSAISLSAPAVKRRLARLEDTGVIRGFTAVLDHEKLGRPIEAFTELRFAGKTRVADIAGIAADLPEVDTVYTTAGDPDALVHLRVRDVADLTRVIDLLRRSGKVVGTKTLIVLGTETPAQASGRR
ncbi:MAG: Lrp/AsnC family transcriptional regulator [Actinobacteria bacterium]|nr:Lrp/AsnC family transcriptional regulator [Actinomycetota bacterium]